jgi:hypothetical protein
MARRISQALFDLKAIGTRLPHTRLVSRELDWWADHDDQLYGTVFIDTTDQDYGWILLARDKVGRFRCTQLDCSYPSQRLAEAHLRTAIAHKSRDPNFTGLDEQGDEPRKPLDLFATSSRFDDNRLHPYFKVLRDSPAREPAREVFRAISPWLVSSDPHLVSELQESQFDQRLWEIYLWAMLRDQGYDVKHTEAPDLIARSPWFNFSIEATTIAPSTSGALANHPNPSTPEEMAEFLSDYMPMKFGSPLISKVNKTDAAGKHYWERGDAVGLPFVIAIADFHKTADDHNLASMTYSQGGLYVYLFGNRVIAETVDGKLIIRNEPVTEHTYGGKTVPSGFFDQPGVENVAAVLFSNAGTLSKFDRIGVMAGFIPEKHKYMRVGQRFDPTPDALVGVPFAEDVSSPAYEEHWGDEVQIFHNPNAKTPLPREAFPDAAHFMYENGELISFDRPGRVLGSMTHILRIKD